MARKKKIDDREFEDLSSYSSAAGQKKKRRKHRKGSLAVKIVLAVICVLLIAVGCVMIYISTDLLVGLTTTNITKDLNKLGIDPEEQNIVLDDSVRSIALFGLDARDSSFQGLSDVIMVFTVDNQHRKIKMTSILRDSRVPIEGDTLQGEHMDWNTKINVAYYYGGPELAIRTLNRNFSAEGSPLYITDYVTVNFANMALIVDAFGGVDMEVTAEEVREINKNLWTLLVDVENQVEQDKAGGGPEKHGYASITRDDILPDASGELNINSGNYVGGVLHLNGNQAVAYCRIRNVGDDFARVHRQQKVLKALVGKLGSMEFGQYPGLIKQMMPYCETSLELNELVGYTPILTQTFTVESISVPNIEHETDLKAGEAEDGIDYLTYDLTAAAKRISSFIYEEASPYWEEYGNTAEELEVGS